VAISCFVEGGKAGTFGPLSDRLKGGRPKKSNPQIDLFLFLKYSLSYQFSRSNRID
jgi:hypothetical protein